MTKTRCVMPFHLDPNRMIEACCCRALYSRRCLDTVSPRIECNWWMWKVSSRMMKKIIGQILAGWQGFPARSSSPDLQIPPQRPWLNVFSTQEANRHIVRVLLSRFELQMSSSLFELTPAGDLDLSNIASYSGEEISFLSTKETPQTLKSEGKTEYKG